MKESEVKTIEDFFEWLPTYMCDGDTLHCEEDDFGNLTYKLYNGCNEFYLKFSSKDKKITRFE